MFETIVFFIFLLSLIGIVISIYRKIPVLAEYAPQISKTDGLLTRIKAKINDKVAVKAINSKEAILLKLLSKSRVMVLKTEHQIGCWLNTLRQNSIEKERCFKENYWEKINAKKRVKKTKGKKSDDNTPV